MIKIAISGKGGVGKTTIAGTFARFLARNGYDVLAIDADPSMNLASALGIRNPPRPLTEFKELIEERAGGPAGVFKLNPRVDDIVAKFGVTGPDNVKLLVLGTIEHVVVRWLFKDTSYSLFDNLEHLFEVLTEGLLPSVPRTSCSRNPE